MSDQPARELFHVGQRVRLSALGLERQVVRRRLGVEAADRRGTVVGFKGNDPGIMRVVLDGNVTSAKFNHTHWTPAE